MSEDRAQRAAKNTKWIVAGVLAVAAGAIGFLALGSRAVAAGKEEKVMKVPLTFSGGHETDRRDGGRPVVLIAAALGVKPEVFREAFRGVTPARNGRPTGEQARANKAALMKVLRPYGITNERLDEVSNYYRYRPQDGELWKATPAEGYAVVENGRVTKLVVTEPGSGYSSPPEVTAEGLGGVRLRVTLRFGKELKTNGAVAAVEVERPAADRPER